MACPRINTGYVGGWDFPPAWYFLRAQAFLLFINSPFLFPNISSYYITEGAARPLSGVISVLHHLKTKSTKTREEAINWTAPMVTVEPKVPQKQSFLGGQLTCSLREKAGLGSSEEVKQEAACHSCPGLCIRVSARWKGGRLKASLLTHYTTSFSGFFTAKISVLH